MKKHEGLTVCPLCGGVYSRVDNLRKHMESLHQLTPEYVRKLIPTRARTMTRTRNDSEFHFQDMTH